MSETLENTALHGTTTANMEVQMEIVPASEVSGGALVSRPRLTARQENFARLYAETGVALEAYATAYNCEGSSRATIRVKGGPPGRVGRPDNR